MAHRLVMACPWTQLRRFPMARSSTGVIGLRKLLVAHRDEFVRTLTEKLLSYALGRGIEHFDLPTVRQITRDAAPTGHRWSALVLGIVKSTPFTMGTITEASQ